MALPLTRERRQTKSVLPKVAPLKMPVVGASATGS
jgi:hypothetical protein